MSTTVRTDPPEVDKRGKYYEERLRNSARFEEFNRPSVELLLNLIYTYDVVETRLSRVLGAHCLSLSGFNILMILNSSPGGCQLHELGELLLVSRANVTGLVDSLEQKGLVERSLDQRDRRVRLARITDAGVRFLDSFLPAYYCEVQNLFAGFDDTEKAALSDLLARLRNAILWPDGGKNCSQRKKTK